MRLVTDESEQRPAVARATDRISRRGTVRPQWLALLPILTLAVASGCSTVRDWFDGDREKDTQYVVALFAFARRDLMGNRLTRTLIDPTGGNVVVQTTPLLSPVYVYDAGTVTGPDGAPALELRLNQYGQNRWLQICAELAGREVAVVLDGFYRFAFRIPRHAIGSQSIVIPGPWTEVEIRRIAAAAADNYRILSKR